jgi:cytochrome P450
MVVNETLRFYPLVFIERKCSKPYKIPGSNFVVPKGMLIQIPDGGIMRSPKFFPDPDNFNPDNFSPEFNTNRNPYAFLSFGLGPRNCIGMRFALMSVKICLIKMVRNFRLLASSKSPEKLVPDPMSLSGQPKGGVWLKIEKRN